MKQSRFGSAVFGRVRTIAVVTGLAALVWALAESQTLQSSVTQTEFELARADVADTYAVRIAPSESWDGVVDVQLRAPAAARDGAEESLRETRIKIEAGRDFPIAAGEHVVDLREVVRRSGVVRGSGAAPQSCEPATVRVEVVELVAVEVEAALELPDVARVSSRGVTPERVTLTVPELALEGIDAGALRAVVRPEASRFGSSSPGQNLRLTGVPVALPAVFADWAWASRVEPRQVQVEVVVDSVTAEHTIERLPVQILVAPSEAGRWVIDLPAASRDLVGVRVSGPEAAIEAIRTGSVRPIAVVRLSFEELEAGIDAKEAEVLGLPGGVTWEADIATIELSVTRRENGGEQGG